MENKVTLEVATAEIERWLHAKKIKGTIREAREAHIKMLVNAVIDGDLIVNEDCTLTQILAFPNEACNELTYKLRLSQPDLDEAANSFKGFGPDVQALRMIKALTGASTNVIRNLDLSTDRITAETIAVFFM